MGDSTSTSSHGLQPLSGLRILDLSASVAGQFCGRLLADHGADVVLGEPAGGTATRHMGPFASIAGRSLESCLFWHLNLGKSSVLLNSDSSEGREHLHNLVHESDIVIVDSTELSETVLALGHFNGIVCCITSFGRHGAWSTHQGSELVHQALSGTMYENGAPDRAPLFGVGHRASYGAAVIGYVQALALLRGGTRRPSLIDVSIAETAASMNFCRATQYSYNREIEGRNARTTPRAIVRCADGWVTVFIYDHRWRQSCLALGLADLVDDPRFTREEQRLANWDAFTDLLDKHLRFQRVNNVLVQGQREKAVVARAVAPSELRTDAQLLARGYWKWTAARPDSLPRLGPMFQFSSTPQRAPGDAPSLPSGEKPVFSAASENADTPRKPMMVQRPLEGITVLDLTTAWSGPMATRILATLGAEILKIEGPGRIDDWRGPPNGGLPSRYPDRQPGDRPYNRCFQFNTQNHDKRDLAIDLKSDIGRELALRLSQQCDVMIANFSAGTLDRMGLGWSVVRELNPRLIQVEMPAYGTGGPITDYVGLGPSMEFMSGMASLIGYGDGRPVTTGPAYLDPIGGFNAAAAVLTALAARDISGVGQHVEMAQRDAALHWIGEEIIFAIATAENRLPHGNRVQGIVPHDAFPCFGTDEWVAIAAYDDTEFAALCRVTQMPELAMDPDYGTVEARMAHEDALYERLATWTRQGSKHEIARDLQAAGVHAAPVCNARDLHESAFLRSRGLLQWVTHPEAGTHLYQGVPLHIVGHDLAIDRPAPCFGADTEAVLRERLALGPSEIEELYARGVISRFPHGSPSVGVVGTAER